jgi:hypothetical protein
VSSKIKKDLFEETLGAIEDNLKKAKLKNKKNMREMMFLH